MRVGSQWTEEGALFGLWAPKAKSVSVDFPESGRTVAMERLEHGYWRAEVSGLAPDARYWFVLNGKTRRADPASGSQPDGVHGPAALIDHTAFSWTDAAFSPPKKDRRILYEMHVGTFTPEGTFDAAAGKLDHLAGLGVNCLELMPVAAFPGGRNWGYDGVFPYAVQESYGGPDGLKRFVDACHGRGLAVVLDVVYNHLGPEGNYLRDFGPYFTKKFSTPWGEGLNFDGSGSDGVREYFIENALYWFENYHIDGLRLDAVDHIWDMRPRHFLRELSERVAAYREESGRDVFLIAESQANDPRMITPLGVGGHGLDGTWNDDFHHSVHALVTGERSGYYADYGKIGRVAEAVADGFSLAGRYSKYYGRSHGLPARHVPTERFVNCLQNHDQIGNRAMSDRLAASVPFELMKTMAALLFLSPGTPMLFMGEEFGEEAPFNYFASHQDERLIEAVRKGRKREFAAFHWHGEPADPFAEETFAASRLDWGRLEGERGRALLAFYKELIRLRTSFAPFLETERDTVTVECFETRKALVMERSSGARRALCVFNFSGRARILDLGGKGDWRKIFDSAAASWGGPGQGAPVKLAAKLRIPAQSAAVYLLQAAL